MPSRPQDYRNRVYAGWVIDFCSGLAVSQDATFPLLRFFGIIRSVIRR